MGSHCVVFVCNKAYFDLFVKTCGELVTTGGYTGSICLAIGDDLRKEDLLHTNDFIKKHGVIVKHFPDVTFPDEFHKVNCGIASDGRHISKKFQWHKLHLFDVYFKKWEYVFYMDCGMSICADVKPMLGLFRKDTLLALSDGFPQHQRRLYDQFDLRTGYEHYKNICDKFDLNIDYFQTGVMLYDTDIIKDDTSDGLYELSLAHPISITNEQGIMALYFTSIRPVWQPLPARNDKTNFYDYRSRDKNDNYVMVKVKN